MIELAQAAAGEHGASLVTVAILVVTGVLVPLVPAVVLILKAKAKQIEAEAERDRTSKHLDVVVEGISAANGAAKAARDAIEEVAKAAGGDDLNNELKAEVERRTGRLRKDGKA